jgi:steroid 5-alpha reductase family enzyme
MTAMELLTVLIATALGLFVVMALAWFVQDRTGHAGWIDVFWTFGVGLVGIVAAMTPPDFAPPHRNLLVAVLAFVWSARLGLHIVRRNLRTPDDPRYARIRAGYGAAARGKMFWLAQKQAIVSIPLVLAIYLAAHNPDVQMRWQDAAGLVLMLVSVAGETTADMQLRSFQRDPKNAGRICDAGLWRWSRHPNYFFEWLGWLAYPLIAIEFYGSYEWAWLSLLAPVVMFVLLRFVSGVPPLEEHMRETRGAAWQAYAARTSAFVPLPRG